MIRFLLNDKEVATGLPPGMVLLDFIRYRQQLMGTKIGCREGDCGACTVLVGEIKNNKLQYESMTCCLVPLGNVHGKQIVTVEGLNMDGLNPVQQAMAAEGATQCGFCTPGFVVSLAGFCLSEAAATPQNAIAAVDGNICRCTGYKSIERAAGRIAELVSKRGNEDPARFAADQKILPAWFASAREKLLTLKNKTNGILIPQENVKQIVGGGTDLYVQQHDEMTGSTLRFVFDAPGLNGIRKEGNKCILGPSVTVSDLKNSELIKDAFPEFDRYAKLVSSTPIRNMATIAGNFINASPIGDFTIFFLALDAQLVFGLTPNPSPEERGTTVISEGDGLRTLPLRELYKGYKTLDKKPEEYIEQIWFELPGKDSLFHFEKVSKRTHLDIASVNTAISIKMKGEGIDSAGISAGGVGPVPLYLKKTSEFLKGKKITEELVYATIEIMETEISPISDARGSKEYKTLLLGQLIKAHFIKMFPALNAELFLR